MVILLGCAGSQVPLSPPGGVPVDPLLIGTWVQGDSQQSGNTDRLTVFQFNDYEYLLEYLEKDASISDLLRLRAYTTPVEGVLFANVQCVGCDDDNDFVFFRYSLTKEGALNVRPVKTELYKDPLFTSSQELLDYIRFHLDDDEIYEAGAQFVRAEQ